MTRYEEADAVLPIFRDDYAERVYAGVLGKIIGVYAGRPFEQWGYDRIRTEIGNIRSYVNGVLGVPLVVTDDDITGTFTFIRAVADSGRGYDTTADDVAEAWLNYLVEKQSVLWWGGRSNSTEHTAYLQLKDGILPPESGSARLNGRVVSEQIGAQIFIEGWPLISPGSPQLAVTLARRAATVSHDGEAVCAAMCLAAMESAAFLPITIPELVEVGLSVIPTTSIIAQLIGDIRGWHHTERDWRKARQYLDTKYGYDVFGGNCHVVPNHGLIVLALLYGDGNFDRSLDIVNSAGWDTDCNSGNLGALLGIWGGLKVIDEGHDWRSPLADRLLIPTADPGNAISDALREATKLVELGYRSAGHDYVPPKGGARFHFSAPGSLQGFSANDERTVIRNETTSSGRMLHILSAAQRSAVLTPTFATPESLQASRYPLDMSPTLYSGQRVRSTVLCARGFPGCQSAQIVIRVYDAHDRLTEIFGPSQQLSTEGTDIEWVIPDTEGQPIQAVGVQVRSECGVDAYLDRLTWDGVPSTRFLRPAVGGTAWRRAWANATEYDHDEPEESFRLIQNRGRGLMLTGTQEWENYCVSAAMLPHAASAMGLVARARGLREYVALRWGADGTLALLHRHRGKDQVLSEVGRPLTGGILGLAVNADTIVGSIDGNNIVEATCANVAACGAIGMFVEDGRVGVDYVAVNPL